MKKCSTCQLPKEVSDFSPDRRAKDGLQAACRACRAGAESERREAHPEKVRASRKRYLQNRSPRRVLADKRLQKRWRAANPEKNAAYKVTFRQRDPERDLRFRLKHGFGMTVEQYRALGESQDWQCWICGCPPPTKGRYRRLSVDHSHITGNVRGLLCVKCNSALGLLGDSVIRLEKAVEYLNKSV